LRDNTSRNSARVTKKDAPDNISSTRGGGVPADCSSETPVETEIGLSGEAVTLKWQKVPHAVKYHLYISDDEEILIDEYETERETSYTFKKPLDAAKTYRWKVVVTTEDGKTIAGDSQKFTVKSLRQSAANRGKSKSLWFAARRMINRCEVKINMSLMLTIDFLPKRFFLEILRASAV
jgi:hypothetical protein